MHFRVRKNVIQLVRTSYDPEIKRGVATVVGTVRLAHPELTEELKTLLTAEETAQFDLWVQTQHRIDALREELAALSLPQSMAQALKWFEREGDTPAASALASETVFQWQALRRQLTKQGLLD